MVIKNNEKFYTFQEVKKMCEEKGVPFQDFLESLRNNEIKTFVKIKDESLVRVHVNDIFDDNKKVEIIFTD